MMAGKAVAAGLSALGGAMDSIFRVERIYYSGSLLQAVRGNFGNLELDVLVKGKKYEFTVTLDVKNILKVIINAVVPPMVKKIAAAIGL